VEDFETKKAESSGSGGSNFRAAAPAAANNDMKILSAKVDRMT